MSRPTLWVDHPFIVPYWRRGELRAAVRALATEGSDPGMGQEIATALGHRDGLATGSGRLALELALRASGVQPDDEVVVPTFGCAALVAAVRAAGAVPAFADIGPDLNVSAETVAAVLAPRTRAVVVVHAGGKRARIEEIVALARERGIAVVEDCAQATGARSGDVPWGTLGEHAIFSFGIGKNLMATAGGLLVGAAPAVSLASEPRVRSAGRLAQVFARHLLSRYTRPAFVALAKFGGRGAPEDSLDGHARVRLSPMDAAIVRLQLRALHAVLAIRRRNGLALGAALEGTDGVLLPDARDHVFTKFYVAIPSSSRRTGPERAPELLAVVRQLLRAGFEPELAYVPLHLRFRGARADVPCPRAEEICPRLLTLPVRPGLEEEEMRALAAAFIAAVRGRG